MGYYLEDNKPNFQQYRCPRGQKESGIIGVHTAESIADESGPDTGAENVARFIRDRSNYGSYHALADSDSIIELVRPSCVAYHIGTHGLNEHTYGISAAVQASRWNEVSDDWRRATIRNMARAAAKYAKRFERLTGKTIPDTRISLSEALDGRRGFLAHGDADPGRRYDPGSEFTWSYFLDQYKRIMRGTVDMPLDKDDKAFIENAIEKRGANKVLFEDVFNQAGIDADGNIVTVRQNDLQSMISRMDRRQLRMHRKQLSGMAKRIAEQVKVQVEANASLDVVEAGITNVLMEGLGVDDEDI